MPGDALPHTYPFRFVETVLTAANTDFSEGRVAVRVSANSRAAMGAQWLSPLLFVEAIAQSALLLQGGDPETGRRGFLAGIEGFTFTRVPEAGESLEVHVRLAGRFGPAIKFEGDVRSGGAQIARAGVVVRREP
jgi:3-hydroxymyristoyl/3-hydroxydecanoyl-(acyl carrier protein) dehydratase